MNSLLPEIGGWGFALVTMPGSAELLLLTVGALLPRFRKTDPPSLGPEPALAVIVPAHNEELTIARTVANLLAQAAGEPGVIRVFVIADNCTDKTASCALQAGAAVLVRQDDERRGKGFALDFAFAQLSEHCFDGYLIVDADTVAQPGLYRSVRARLAAGAAAVQCRYTVANPGDSVRTQLMEIALQAFNVLRPSGRARWGLSAGILGNGFALSRRALAAVPYSASSVVEDLEYHLRLVEAGLVVQFAGEAAVLGEMPTGGPGARTQRARWDGGRFRMIVEWSPRLLRGISRGAFRLIEPLLDLWLLPLAFHLVFLTAAAGLGTGFARGLAVQGLFLVVVHVSYAVRLTGHLWPSLRALLTVPFYVIWKLSLLSVLLQTARRNAAWVRTARNREGV